VPSREPPRGVQSGRPAKSVRNSTAWRTPHDDARKSPSTCHSERRWISWMSCLMRSIRTPGGHDAGYEADTQSRPSMPDRQNDDSAKAHQAVVTPESTMAVSLDGSVQIADHDWEECKRLSHRGATAQPQTPRRPRIRASAHRLGTGFPAAAQVLARPVCVSRNPTSHRPRTTPSRPTTYSSEVLPDRSAEHDTREPLPRLEKAPAHAP